MATYPSQGLDPWYTPLRSYIDDKTQEALLAAQTYADDKISGVAEIAEAGVIDELENPASEIRGVLDAVYGGGGGGGGTLQGYYLPESYGAVGDGTTNDRLAIQAAIDAASAAGGGIVLLSKQYGWTGDIIQKMGVTVQGVQFSGFGAKNAGLKALSSSARYRYGTLTGSGQHPYVGKLTNLVIDANNVGGVGELVRVEAVEGIIRDVVIFGGDRTVENPEVQTGGAGDGISLLRAQNCLLDHVSVGGFPNGSAIKIANVGNITYVPTGPGVPQAYYTSDQGAGGNKIVASYFHTSKRLFQVTYQNDTVPTSPPGDFVQNFWPHDNIFIGCLFEQYQEDCELLGRLSDGETRFSHCTFTGSRGMITTTEDCIILLENQIRSAMPTIGTFDSCDFGAGSVGKTALVRSKSYSVANVLRVYGKTSVNNAGQGYFFADDRGPQGGAGTLGGVFGPVDGLTAVDDPVATLAAATSTNTLTVTSGISKLAVTQRITIIDGATLNPIASDRRITSKDTTTNQITIDGSPVTVTSDDYTIRPGVGFATGMNGGNGALVIEVPQPVRYVIDPSQGRPFQTRRKGDKKNRFSISRDGELYWQNGVDEPTTAWIKPTGFGLTVMGETIMQVAAGPTSTRPIVAPGNTAGTGLHNMMIDTTINKMIWYDGTNWRDAMGNIV